MKSRHKEICCIIVALLSQKCASEFFTMTTLGIGSVGTVFTAIGTYYYCHFVECCTDEYIPINVAQLQDDIDTHIFGQPLLQEIVKIMNGYKYSKLEPGASNKALVLSFHGWPGTGKNFMVDFILKAFYKRGLESSYRKMYIGRNDFPDSSRIHEYQARLKKDIGETVSKCGRAIFIFDEVNDIPEGVLDILKPFMGHHEKLDGLDFRRVIFILLSNINGNEIAEHMLAINKPRNSLKLSDFEGMLRTGSFTSSGGLKNAASIRSHLIDHYIPFLPLEQKHVELCVRAEFKKSGFNSPSQEDINNVMSIMTYGPPGNSIFANAGCKRIKKQVAYVLGDRQRL